MIFRIKRRDNEIVLLDMLELIKYHYSDDQARSLVYEKIYFDIGLSSVSNVAKVHYYQDILWDIGLNAMVNYFGLSGYDPRDIIELFHNERDEFYIDKNIVLPSRCLAEFIYNNFRSMV